MITEEIRKFLKWPANTPIDLENIGKWAFSNWIWIVMFFGLVLMAIIILKGIISLLKSIFSDKD